MQPLQLCKKSPELVSITTKMNGSGRTRDLQPPPPQPSALKRLRKVFVVLPLHLVPRKPLKGVSLSSNPSLTRALERRSRDESARR